MKQDIGAIPAVDQYGVSGDSKSGSTIVGNGDGSLSYHNELPSENPDMGESHEPTGTHHFTAKVFAATTALDTQIGGEHYQGFAITPIDFVVKNNFNYCEGNVIKYVSRHRRKNGKEDLLKAIHYLEMLIETEYSD